MTLTKEQEAVIERAERFRPSPGTLANATQSVVMDLLAIVKALQKENESLWAQNQDLGYGTLQQQIAECNRTFEDNVHAISLLKAEVTEQWKDIQQISNERDKAILLYQDQQAELEHLRALLRKVNDGASGFGVAEKIEAVVKERKS